MKAKVVTGAERKAALLECGAKLAAKHGAVNVTRRMVAKACKVSEGLVTAYMGTTADAQKLYTRQAKKLGLKLPTKEQVEAIGAKLRAHGPRKAPVKRTSRKRSVKEVQAIREKIAGKRASPALAKALRKPAAKKSVSVPAVTAAKPAGKLPRKAGAAKKPVSAVPAVQVAARRPTAARTPKAPPTLPPPPLPPLPLEAVGLPPLPLH
jgi:AcrR family transcriptional regulator